MGLRRTIFHFFPDLLERLEKIADPRLRREYTMTEILLGGLFMFITKQDSRNAMNNDREEPIFADNYQKLFGKRLPHISWHFIVTLKDGSLKSLWEDIELELLTSKNQLFENKNGLETVYRWLSGLSYQEQTLSFMECVETKAGKTNRFVFVTDLSIDSANVNEAMASGRLRFKIENEGFNTQKNLGYGLGRKYSRTSNDAMKNYVSLLQIAHLLNQLYELSSIAKPLLQGKTTIKYLWKRLISALLEVIFEAAEPLGSRGSFQIRYE